MRQRYCRLVSMVILTTLLLQITCIGDSRAQNKNELNCEDISLIENVLSAMNMNKKDYGLADVEFSSLILGKEIFAYEVLPQSFRRIENIHFYPVFFENKWVLTVIISKQSMQAPLIEISTKFAEEYGRHKSSMNNPEYLDAGVGIFYDNTAEYLVCDNYDYIQIGEFPKETPFRGSLKDIIHDASDVLSPLLPECALNTISYAIPLDSEQFASLDILPIRQPTRYTCWAASTAMILNYRGFSSTVSDVVNAANVTMYNYQSAAQCSSIISQDYGYPCGTWGYSSGYYYSMTLNNFITELFYFESPIFAGFSDGIGHAVVIKGYTNLSSTPTMAYIDPFDAHIKAAPIPSDGDISIYYNAGWHSLNAAFAVYE